MYSRSNYIQLDEYHRINDSHVTKAVEIFKLERERERERDYIFNMYV